MQGPAMTAVFAAAELLPKFISADIPLTIAVLVIVAPGAALTFTTRLIATDPAGAIAPSEQMTAPVPPTGGVLQLPGLVSDTNVVPAGITSVKVTPASVLGPLFETAIVYVMFEPVTTGSGASDLVICRSETGPIPTTVTHCENSEVLFEGSVAVAVITSPTAHPTGKVTLMAASQTAGGVVTLVNPMKV